MLVFAAAASASASGYGLFLLETLGALALIAVAAWAAVRLANKRFHFSGRGIRMRSIERLSLDSRRSIHLIAVDKETLLVGVSENSVTLLKTLPHETVPAAEITPTEDKP